MIAESTIATRDGRIVCYTAGDGPRTVVCLHGWTRAPRVWFPALAAVPPGWRAVVPDLVLHSDPPRGGYTLAALGERIAALLDALAVPTAVIAGHSMGGGVALSFALAYPRRLERLILICTGPFTVPDSWQIRLLREQGQTPETMARILRGWFHHQPDPAEFAAILADGLAWPGAALHDLRTSMETTDFRPRLAEITVPTLVIHGGHDDGRPLDQAQALATAVSHGTLITLPDCGHTPTQETPDAFNRCFWPFVQDTEPPQDDQNMVPRDRTSRGHPGT